MRKFNSKKIVSLFLALMMLVGMMSISVFAETETQTEESEQVVYKNVWIGEKIDLMFALPTADVEGKNVVITANDVVVPQYGTQDFEGVAITTYKAANGVAAQNIDRIYNVNVEIDGETVANFTYSVLEFLYERLYVDGVTGAEKDMLNNLIAFADSADKFINEDATGIADKYVYVNTVDCTFDGGKTAGVVEKGAAVAFASNLIADDYHDLVYTIATIGSDEAVTKTADEMANYAFDANATVTASLVENGNTPVIPDEPDPEPDVEPILTTTTYTFANYAAGTQYARNEEHVLDDNVTLVSDNAHFTSELRLYSSETNNSTAVIKSVLPISEITMNIGYKADTLAIYGSNDNGETWDEIGSVTTEGTSYVDKTVTFETTYTWIKLDVAGTSQMRIKTITLTTASTCAHENVSTKTIAPTCVETGYIVTTCNDCGYVVERVVGEAATGHDYDEEITEAATCTTAGVKTLTCACGDTKTETIAPTGHSVESGVCPDCGEDVGGSVAPTVGLLATFEFGANKTSASEGTADSATYTESNNGYTLSITGASKFYKNSYDASGNACIKLGSSSVAGKFTFTVPDNVTEVIIYVAGRQAKDGGIKVNGTQTVIKTHSNDSTYTEIVIDTSANKTVTVESYKPTNGDIRLYMNTIVFNGYAQ